MIDMIIHILMCSQQKSSLYIRSCVFNKRVNVLLYGIPDECQEHSCLFNTIQTKRKKNAYSTLNNDY